MNYGKIEIIIQEELLKSIKENEKNQLPGVVHHGMKYMYYQAESQKCLEIAQQFDLPHCQFMPKMYRDSSFAFQYLSELHKAAAESQLRFDNKYRGDIR